MSEVFQIALYTFFSLIRHASEEGGIFDIAFKFIPFALLFELPFQITIMLGVLYYWLKTQMRSKEPDLYYPVVSCMITCYSEGPDAAKTVYSLANQLYPGLIEIIPIIDSAYKNKETYDAILSMEGIVKTIPNRRLVIIPKWQRGGRVSSLNSGLAVAHGEIVCALDGDTSFDNDMIWRISRHFKNPNIVGVAGNLRIRNYKKNIITRLQALEYMMSIGAGKTGLSELGIVNNISGAFGAFRKKFVQQIGGWDAGTAEDLDITTRIKNYFGRYPHLRIVFEPYAIGHTDAPDSVRGFLKQRLRWDGDLGYLYIRKFWRSFNPRILGWRNFLLYLWVGLFFQIILPFLLVIYTTYIFVMYETGFALGSLAVVYLFYVIVTYALFIEYVLLISERPLLDIRLAPLILLYPAFSFMGRVWNGFATLSELFLKSHLDSSMAPWWVLRKTKF